MGTLCAESGLAKLAEIIKRARGRRSYREFESVTSVSHATLRRIELCEVKSPDYTTLSKLAPFTPYKLEELQAIALGKSHQAEIREYLVAEDVLPMVNELPKAEAGRLAQMIISRLAGL